ncbi:MAG: hypothetical protein A3J75_04980 [Acidobacteria bacterium RBG_16_68_9]|nr:MAG: hypothetical protein A3J75_04980 [Acidobacteria bacterium RBG_16_68_9]
MTWELVIPTRGDVGPVLAGLIPHALSCPFNLRIMAARMPDGPCERGLVETLGRMGCYVTVEQQMRLGAAAARAQAADTSAADVIVFLDDDAVLAPAHSLPLIALGAERAAWATPVVRFVQNFNDPPPGHTEVWDRVDRGGKAVRRALIAQGEGWIRTFDTGESDPTDQLGGTCFAVRREALVASRVTEGWAVWPSWVGASDRWAGRRLGVGVVVPDTFAYHFGRWSPEKWGAGRTVDALTDTNPEAMRAVAEEMSPWTR